MYNVNMATNFDSNAGSGSGLGYSSGYSDGSGSGCGYIDGSSSGNGDGIGDGYEEKRLQIELNILSHIPDSDLPLFIGEWEFEETKKLFEDRLKWAMK
jgi:hypothetical protein